MSAPDSNAPPIETLLIIDDNEFDLSLYERLVVRSGVAKSIRTFADAQDALNYLRQGGDADAIVLDINMPGMDGFEFLEVLNAELEADQFVVVMLSTSRDVSDQERANQFPVVKDYIFKPPTADTFRKIAKLVAG
jgi:CheY-like chemotaxis protein